MALSGIAVAFGQEGFIKIVRLNFADAAYVVSLLGGVAPERAEPNLDAFVYETIAGAVRQLPQAEGQWLSNFLARSFPVSSTSSGPIRLPEGLSQPPVAILEQNAILLRGTPEALDRTEEIIALLDKPQAMINIELKLLDDPQEKVREWGLDFQALGGPVAVGSAGNAPATGLQLRYSVANLHALFGWDVRQIQGRNVTGANVTTFNNTPASIAFGQALPFFVSHVTYDFWGNRYVDVEPYVIFTGIELWVHPRLTGGDTVTMRLVPTIVEAMGAVTAPDGSSVPITKHIVTDTQVRVRDGESMIIGGLQRLADETTQRFRSLLGEKRISRSSHPVLIVTPHIIRPTP